MDLSLIGMFLVRARLLGACCARAGQSVHEGDGVQTDIDEAGVRLCVEFVSNDRNRQMLITYRFAGFREVGREGEVSLMENDYSAIQTPPPYVDLRVLEV